MRLLRAVLGVLGRPRFRQERNCFVKLFAADIRKMPLLRRAFPDVPWLFLYREPLEVLAVYLRYRASSLPPGVAAAGLIEGDPQKIAAKHPEEFWTQVLGTWFSAALEFGQFGKVLLLNYTQLPEAVWESVLHFCGIACSADDIELMRAAAAFNAKHRSQQFSDDSERKRGSASAQLRALVDEFVRPQYQQLEKIRLSQDPQNSLR